MWVHYLERVYNKGYKYVRQYCPCDCSTCRVLPSLSTYTQTFRVSLVLISWDSFHWAALARLDTDSNKMIGRVSLIIVVPYSILLHSINGGNTVNQDTTI